MDQVWQHDNPPPTCAHGHRLGPRRVVVSFARCRCDRARHGGHLTWACRVCDDVRYSDGHVDDTGIVDARPAPLTRHPDADGDGSAPTGG